jgi:hypothetical protein
MIGKIITKLKERLVNWLVKDIVIEGIHTKKLIDKGNTLYVDIADFDHNTSDGTRTESQMWYNSTDHVLRYRNDTETVDIGGGGFTISEYSDADLAASGTYTIADAGLYTVGVEEDTSPEIRAEFSADDATTQWDNAGYVGSYENHEIYVVDASRARLRNTNAGEAEGYMIMQLEVSGVTFSSDRIGISSSSSNTPAEGVWSTSWNDADFEIQHYITAITAWGYHKSDAGLYKVGQGMWIADGTNVRIYNSDGSTNYFNTQKMAI